MSNDDNKGVVDLSDPKAREYQDRIAAAKKGSTPVGGAPMPNIPRLDQPPPGAPRDRALGVQQAHSQQAAAQGPHGALTPEQYKQAVQDGRIIPGVGGGYMANQPRGVQAPQQAPAKPQMSRYGDEENPAVAVRPEGGLSPETVNQLNAVAQANSPEAQEEEKLKEEAKELHEELGPQPGEADDDNYDYAQLGQISRNLLSNHKRKEAIEARCEEMDFEDLILNQELRQEVKIKKGFIPVFRTPSGEEDLFVKRYIGDEEGSTQYIMDKYAVYGLCCGLYSLNGQPLPDHRGKDGKVDEAAFLKKLEFLLKYPLVLLADLSVNFTWFTLRVQQLLSLDKVKDF
jgi:hypothetical protein